MPPRVSHPWQLGYRLAEECRAMLSLKPERVFDDVDDVAALFGGAGFEAADGRVPGLRAEAYCNKGAPKIIVAKLAGAAIPDFRDDARDRRLPRVPAGGDARQ